MQYHEQYDVIIVGGGHAAIYGAECANLMKKKVLLVVPSISSIAVMGCSPNVGSPGRSHLHKEIESMMFGAKLPTCIDKSLTSINIINDSKGPAMHARHAILDKELYKQNVLKTLFEMPYVSILQQEITDVIIENNKAVGVVTSLGIKIKSKAVILCTGTFLNGKMHTGLKTSSGGRIGEAASITLAERLKELKLPMARLKTGTPPRLDARTINYSKLTEKWGSGAHDGNRPVFSLSGNKDMHPKQLPHWGARTSMKTHDALREGFDESPFILQHFEGEGPGYCPSIEDKITRFADKESHQLNLEYEGINSSQLYVAGFNTSLPFSAQINAIHSIEGLENAVITQPGYAVEYDCFKSVGFKRTFEFKDIENLYVATARETSGYFEANFLGFITSLQCCLKLEGKEPWQLERHHGYMGVMLDDLFTKEHTSAYRALTSLNPYRLSCGEMMSQAKFTPIGRKLGLVHDEAWDHFCRKQDAIARLQEKYKLTWLNSKNLSNEEAIQHIGSPLTHETNLASLIKRPEMSYEKITAMPLVQAIAPELSKSEVAKTHGDKLAQEIVEQVEISFKYEGYINRQQEEVKRMSIQNNIKLPIDFDYATITALSTEVKQKLNQFKPETIGQASRISGVTPSAISLLLIWLKKNKMLNMQTV